MSKWIEVTKVTKYNATGLCSEKTCDNHYTHYVQHSICGITLLTPLCKKHAEIIHSKFMNDCEV